MPLILQKQINAATKIGVWHITEAEDFFYATVPLQRAVTHPHKRLQHLAGRFLLLQLFPAFPLDLVQIADTRKPFLPDEAFHFSISHCGDFAAAIVSTEQRVGIDIEIPRDKIETLQHKFLSVTEQRMLTASGDAMLMLTMAWSIKEAVFKWYGEGRVDFINHIQISGIQKSEIGFIAGCEFLKEQSLSLSVHSMLSAGNNLSWVVG